MATTTTAKAKYPILEFVHGRSEVAGKVDKGLEHAEQATLAVKLVAGSEAFRNYSILAAKVENHSGNLRGMVISAKWRTVFTFSENTEKVLGSLGTIAGITASIAENAPQFETIYRSSGSPTIKAAQMSSLAGTMALRVLGGAIPAGVHVIYLSLEGWAQLVGLAPGMAPAAQAANAIVVNADTLVQTTFNRVTDTNNIAAGAWSVVNFAFATTR
jgi:hypothetical protein